MSDITLVRQNNETVSDEDRMTARRVFLGIVMRQFHEDMVAFVRTDHAGKTLWPHLSLPARIEQVEDILFRFNA